jgi:hypothetical protein
MPMQMLNVTVDLMVQLRQHSQGNGSYMVNFNGAGSGLSNISKVCRFMAGTYT